MRIHGTYNIKSRLCLHAVFKKARDEVVAKIHLKDKLAHFSFNVVYVKVKLKRKLLLFKRKYALFEDKITSA